MRILTRIPHPGDGVSFYRGFGPLSHLRKIMHVEFVQLQDFNWPALAMSDGLYMVRPATDHDVALMKMAHRCGKPVWIDYDDHVLDIPPSNPSFGYYAKKNIKENIKYLIEHANVVSVSTEFLVGAFGEYRKGKPIHLIENAFPNNLLDWNKPDVPRKKVISWRGSRTHDKDLSIGHGIIKHLQELLPAWEFYFFGEIDYRTMDILDMSRTRIFPYSDVIEFMHAFKACGSSIHLVPLEDNAFNRSKSNISWIEATWAGATTFASSLPEWQKPGITALDLVVDHIENDVLNSLHKKSFEYISKHLLLDHVNAERVNILESWL